MMKMVKYVALISDQVSGCEELEMAFDSGDFTKIDVYRFELPEGSSDEMALMYGRGIFFTHDWGMDGTTSVVIRLD